MPSSVSNLLFISIKKRPSTFTMNLIGLAAFPNLPAEERLHRDGQKLQISLSAALSKVIKVLHQRENAPKASKQLRQGW